MLSKRTSLALLLVSWSASATFAAVGCSSDPEPATPPAGAASPEASVSDVSTADTSTESPGDPTDAGTDGDGDSGCVPSPAGLVAWWTGDDTLDDHHGPHEASSESVAYAAGKHGSGFAFPASAATMTVATGDAPALDLETGLTIEAWIQPAVAGQDGRIVDKITSGAIDGYLLDLLQGKPRLLVGSVVVLGPDELPAGTFVHVAGTFELGVGGRLYVNGTEIAAVETDAGVPANDLPFTIGSTSSKSVVFDGVIDELAVYGRALTAQEIAAIAQAPGGRCK